MQRLKPSRATLMIKPVGAACNLACEYCYYLAVEDELYDGRVKRMATADLESILAGWLPAADDQVTIAWQGGEPTLAGLGFFRDAMRLIRHYRRPSQTIQLGLQTNGTLLDDAWGQFLFEHQFLVGISVDGLAEDHDHYRIDPAGRPTYERVMKGLDVLRRHRVEHNVLCVINRRNAEAPLRVYKELLRLRQAWMQFIPAIEWVDADTGQPHDGYDGTPGTPILAPYSPTAEQVGRFYCEIFDYWFAHDRHRVSVRFFDNMLGAMLGMPAAECTHGPACHSQLTVEHNGDVFGCDHYVQRRWQLGSVRRAELPQLPAAGIFVPLTLDGHDLEHAASGEGDLPDANWFDRLDHHRLNTFADRKLFLAPQCRACQWQVMCYGGCPKHRAHRGDQAEPTVLCSGYQQFFAHASERMGWLADHLRRGQTPPPPGSPAARQMGVASVSNATSSSSRRTYKKRRH